jgi:hypothetical protein
VMLSKPTWLLGYTTDGWLLNAAAIAGGGCLYESTRSSSGAADVNWADGGAGEM